MKPRGIIYQHGKTPAKGEVILVLPLLVKLLYNFFRGVGAGLVAVVVILIVFLYGPVVKEELRYTTGQITGDNQVSEDIFVQDSKAEQITKIQEEASQYGVGTYFSVVIPKISAYSNVIANVDPWDPLEYERVLKNNVAHAKGTYFPGQGRSIYLFSHSTDSALNVARYNAVFYLLRKLETGDKIIVFFSDKKYIYSVREKVIVTPKDIKWITEPADEEILILQTCDPPGTTINRLLVIAELEN